MVRACDSEAAAPCGVVRPPCGAWLARSRGGWVAAPGSRVSCRKNPACGEAAWTLGLTLPLGFLCLYRRSRVTVAKSHASLALTNHRIRSLLSQKHCAIMGEKHGDSC